MKQHEPGEDQVKGRFREIAGDQVQFLDPQVGLYGRAEEPHVLVYGEHRGRLDAAGQPPGHRPVPAASIQAAPGPTHAKLLKDAER